MSVTTIDGFAKQYIGLARTRGLTPRNPITFLFRPNANDQTEVHQVVVSMTEPSFSEKPYNLIWIDANSGSPQYMYVLRRTSSVSDGNHRGSWVTVNDYAQLFSQKQFFRFVVENAGDLGIDVGELEIPHATTNRLGSVVTKDEPASSDETVAVSSSDPRMSNARYPTNHDHPDYARTMIRLNATAFVEVSSSNEPQEGYVLAIVDQDPTNPNKYIGKWVKPTADNVEWESPHLMNLRISLPGNASYMSDNSSVKLNIDAEWSDRIEHQPAGVEWSIEENVIGVTISQDGTVTAPDLAADVVLKVTARKRDPVYGNWVTATYNLLIKNTFIIDDELVSISIVGTGTLFYKQKETYTVTARYKSGNVATIMPTNFVVDNANALDLVGLQGTAKKVSVDTVVKLTATYVYNGVTFTANKNVTVKAQLITQLEVLGASTIVSQQSATYTFRITWSNGDTEMVTQNSFTAAPTTYTTISGNVVTARKETVSDRQIVLTATYITADQTVTGTKNVTILKETEAVVLSSLTIQGANTIRSEESANYTFLATYSDGSTKLIDPTTFTADRLDVVTIVNKTVNAGKVSSDIPVKLSATYTENGITKSATLDILIVNVVPVVDLSSIKIVGPSSVQEKTTTPYTVLATYSDGHTATITPNEFRLQQPSNYATFTNSNLVAGAVDIANTSVTIYASYTENGITKTATLGVTIVGNPPVVTSLEVRGADQMNENTTSQFTAWEILSNGTERQVTAPTWSVIQGSAIASIAQTGILSAGEVTQDTTVLIRATYDGRNAQKSVLVKNIIVISLLSVQPLAPSPAFDYGTAAAVTRDLHSTLTFSDSSTREGTSGELSYTLSSNAQTYFEIVAGGTTGWRIRTKAALTGFFGTLTFQLNVVATVGSVTKTGSVQFTVTGPTDDVSTVEIIGADSITEGTASGDYLVRITRLSGSQVEYTSLPTWSLPQGAAYVTLGVGTTSTRAKLTSPPNSITQNQTVILRAANVVVDGKTYAPEKTIQIINQAATITKRELIGPTAVNKGETGTYILRLTFSDNTTVDLTPVVTRSSGSTTGFTFNGNNTITGNTVSTTQTAVITGTASYNSQAQTANLTVTNTPAPPTPDSVVITGPASIIGGVTTAYTATATLSDGTTPDVTADSGTTWSVAVKSGTVTGLSVVGGSLKSNAVTADAVVTITVSYVKNGKTVTATKDVTLKPQQSSDLGARFGWHSKIKSVSGYDAAFVQGLQTALTLTGQQLLNCPGGTSTSTNNVFFYVAWPKSLGYGYFVESAQGFAGSWDGALEFDDFNFAGPAEVTINGVDYVVYRNDFPFDNLAYTFKLTYGSSTPGSGTA
ncbi:tail protein [Erwinia phage pEa_SNUABM_16]|uniref:Uncharacterized protein n=1 Tax=Erwinia phage pEa_SNUABM_16 TaxID=2869544 RepID=A0AAE8XQ35_9CAUD|nr:tail protein [Erwinia phage pEa_SNUABM_16]QZE59061.1 hypothetical protein pEaSNUABM18_00158 [Erwinia phage pEa_SNUABM_18]UAW96302.1 hypothetical protein pEaSNUABM16_00158 [Erwinia phage pEa_SNUABM_16]